MSRHGASSASKAVGAWRSRHAAVTSCCCALNGQCCDCWPTGAGGGVCAAVCEATDRSLLPASNAPSDDE